MRAFLLERRRETVLVSALILLASLVTFIGTRLYATYRNATDIGILTLKLDAHIADQEGIHKQLRNELDEIRRTLYDTMADAQATKQTVRRPLSLEPWMLNRFKLLEEKDRAFERRLYQIER